MKIHKAFNILLIIVMLLTGFSASPVSTSAQGVEEAGIDQMNTFSVLAGLGAESLGLTQIEGNLGIAAEGAEALGDWRVGGEKHLGPDSLAGSALEEARSLDAELAQRACDTTVVGDPSGPTTVVLTPGVTCLEGESVILKEVTFDVGEAEPAEFIIWTAGDIIFSEDSRISVTEPESVASIYWQITGTLTTGERSQLQGTFLVVAGIETGLQTDVIGRLISLEGSVLAKESRVHFKADLPTPEPPIEPTEVPIPEPTEVPIPEPTEEPTPEPTEEPTPEPTEEPTPEPTEEPTPEPTEEPTTEPTEEPTPEPTEEPTPEPTEEPTPEPTEEPKPEPTEEPTLEPTETPNKIEVIIPDDGEIVPEHYIVVLKSENSVKGNENVIESTLEAYGGSIVYFYEVKYNGYLAKLPPDALKFVQSNPMVERIEMVALQEGQSLDTEVVNAYFSIRHTTLEDGTKVLVDIINGPSKPPEGYSETLGTISPNAVTLASFPSYDWVFGCSAVSGAMHAAYYDRNGYPNVYTGPTNGGVMPLTDTSWGTWSDGYENYPNNPLVASHNGVDGRTTRGSIDDYWVKYDSSAADPYITGGWTQHTWGTAIGDYMKTSQSAYGNTDGSTMFPGYSSADKYQCSNMPSYAGLLGVQQFYQARGYTVTTCFSQRTDNQYAGGFSLADFQAEINAGRPVLLSLTGHTIIGYGYSGSTIYIRDTWDSNPANIKTMTWGGSYSGLELRTAHIIRLAPAGTIIPTPLSPNGYIYLKYPTFKWEKVPGASSYDIQVYTGSYLIIDKVVSSSACGTTYCSTTIGPLPYVSLYFWRARAYTGSWGGWSEYKYFTRLNPIPTLVWPSGTITVSNPYFQWKPIPGATHYNIELYKNTGLYTTKTVTNTACNSTICSTRLSNNLPIGSYYWRVKVYIEGSWNSFSDFKYFSRTPPPPTPLSPNGYIYLKYPTFKWEKVPGASSYDIQVYTGSYLIIDKVVSASACGTTYCSTTIGPLPYVSLYFWRARAYTGSWGGWSEYKYFTRLNPIPTLVWPSGTITVSNPYFQWKPIPGATHYNIELYRNSTLYTYMTLTSNACSSTICQVRLSNNLPYGNYFWRVKAYIEGSWNPFSDFKYFTVSAPVNLYTIAPKGDITYSNPTYSWSKIPSANKYEVQLYQGTLLLKTKTVYYTSCGATACYTTLGALPTLGSYSWRVRAYVNNIWGGYTALAYFRLYYAQTGFYSDFTSNADGWTPLNGSWYVENGYYTSPGMPSNHVSTYHSGNYTDFDLELRMKRDSSAASWRSNTIWFRGDATLDSDNFWNNGYYLEYEQPSTAYPLDGGYLYVGYCRDGYCYNIDSIGSMDIIDGWNKILIRARGYQFYVYFNDVMIWSGQDTRYSVGKVGVGFNRSSIYYEPYSNLYIDYVCLTPVSTNMSNPVDEDGGLFFSR